MADSLQEALDRGMVELDLEYFEFVATHLRGLGERHDLDSVVIYLQERDLPVPRA